MSSFTAIRIFRGCRALLAPAKSSTSTAGTAVKVAAAAPKSKAKAKPKPKAEADAIKPKRNVNRNAGILKPTPISPALGSFLGGAPESSRAEAVKQIWSHIKLHNLQNPANKREIICDDKLKELFEGKEKVNFLEIGKLLSRHFVKAE
ncbi:upstream activation factor subunit spp27 [Rosa rugosa]|uniref:upstream activation factor subunit spp27 n=1 Tax=Rosa rugosa TaxID=74645 RepID=UPI002B401AE4|nr:upstream activation factor subunit spp27 [Rosa rugosa]